MFGPISEGMRLFRSRSTIAVVGYSDRDERVSNKVTRFLIEEGNHVVGVNPNAVDSEMIEVKPQLADLENPVDMIQVFRRSTALPDLASEILALPWRPKMVWCQQGVFDMVFQEKLERVRIQVVMDACPYALRSYL